MVKAVKLRTIGVRLMPPGCSLGVGIPWHTILSVDEVLKKFAKAEAETRRRGGVGVEKRRAVLAPRRALLNSWRREHKKLSLTVRRGKGVG
jgi:hypothetical protein